MQLNKAGNNKCIKKYLDIFKYLIFTLSVFILSGGTVFALSPDDSFTETDIKTLENYSSNTVAGFRVESIDSKIKLNDLMCSNKKCIGASIENTDCYACLYKAWNEDLKEYTKELCKENNIEYKYVLAIIWNESRFQSDVQSRLGDSYNYGLMQVNSVTFDFLNEKIGLENVEELFDPETNILAGITLLSYHRQFVDNDRDMIFRYQVGEGNYNEMKKKGINSIPVLKNVLNKAEDFSKIIE